MRVRTAPGVVATITALLVVGALASVATEGFYISTPIVN